MRKNHHALVVDDDPNMLRAVGDILDSLNHTYHTAVDQESARDQLATEKYSYVVLDLNIPVKQGRPCRVANGRNLLRQIHEVSSNQDVPVIVLAEQGDENVRLAVSIIKAGATDCVVKPFRGDELDKAIYATLKVRDQKLLPAPQSAITEKALTPFSAEKRVMVIEEDCVTICGIELWRDRGQQDMRKVFLLLKEEASGGYVHISGPKLMEKLDRDPSNPISRPIKKFCEDAIERLKEHRALDCGRYDIIDSRSGYHFTDWMQVRVGDSEARESEANENNRHGPRTSGNAPTLNDRQKWILGQLANGVQLRLQAIVQHTEKSRSTIIRDLKALQDTKLIITHDDGHYVLANTPKSPVRPKEIAYSN